MATNQDNNQAVKMRIMGRSYPVAELARYDIVGGPSMLDLIVSYAYAREEKDTRPVKFVLESAVGSLRIHCSILLDVLSLRYEALDDENLHLNRQFIEGSAWPVVGSLDNGCTDCRAFYDISAQTGYLYACERFPLRSGD